MRAIWPTPPEQRRAPSPALLRALGNGARDWQDVERLIVIPGGGPGDASTDNGFPLWTEQRTDAAIAEWQTHCVAMPERCAILALSAGSMNAPSARKVRRLVWSGLVGFSRVWSRRVGESRALTPPPLSHTHTPDAYASTPTPDARRPTPDARRPDAPTPRRLTPTFAVLQSDGTVIFESSRIARHLMEAGIPSDSVLCDWISWDTVANVRHWGLEGVRE